MSRDPHQAVVNASLQEQLEREFDTCSNLELPSLGSRPMLTPSTEAELSEALRFAQRERLGILPVGAGSKLDWMPQLDSVDLVVSTRLLAGVIAYEPGDGTLTARSGSLLADLEHVVAEGGHKLTPQVPTSVSSTLGGVLAAGQSGWDRGALGPARHHVLGMRVALADGRVVRSGGRLVKNVTGFDLHRLYTGSFGTLCVILEASLRLFPAADRSTLLRVPCSDLEEALALVGKLGGLGSSPRVVTLDAMDTRILLHVFLAGRPEATDWLSERVSQLLPAAERFEGQPALNAGLALRNADHDGTRWSPLHLTCMPSQLPAILRLLRRELPGAAVHARPCVAELFVRFAVTEPPIFPTQLLSALNGLGARVHLRAAQSRALGETKSSGASKLSLCIQRELDPHSIFAGSMPALTYPEVSRGAGIA